MTMNLAKIRKGEKVSLKQHKEKEYKPRGKYNREEDRLRPLIIKELRKRGFQVWRVETSIQHQLGLPDLWIANRLTATAGWIEVKTPTGVLSEEQKEFADLCWLSKVNHCVLRSVEGCDKLWP